MKKNNLNKKYYGILTYSYTEKNDTDVFTLKETTGDCCCFNSSIQLYTTKKEAKAYMYDNELPDVLVEFTTKIVK